jgi:hypothetical protein
MGLDSSITSLELVGGCPGHPRHRRDRFFALFAALGLLLDLALDFAFARTRSGSFLPPVSAVPLLEGLIRDLPFDQELRKLAPLRLALEWHARTPSTTYHRDVVLLVERSLAWASDNADVTISLEYRKQHVSQFRDVAVKP